MAEREKNDYEAFYEMVKKWTIKDYCTPGIKAEVIFDMLLSEFIEEIVCYHLQKRGQSINVEGVELLLKEFPIRTKSEDNRNIKVDYLVADHENKTMYLVELKTTEGSYSLQQKAAYEDIKTVNFGELHGFLNRLIEDYALDEEKAEKRAASDIAGSEKYVTFSMKKRTWNHMVDEIDDYKINVLYISLTELDKEASENNIILKNIANEHDLKKIMDKKSFKWEKIVEIMEALWTEKAWVKYVGKH